MEGNVIKGDDVVKVSATSAAEGASEKSYDNFHKEVFGQRDKNMQNGSTVEGSGHALSNAVREGTLKDPAKINSLSDVIGHAIDNGKITDKTNNFKDILKHLIKTEGVNPLSTGDFLVREDGKETLFTPDGDRVTVNPDGTHVIKGDVKAVTNSKSGETTVTFGDGSTVSFDKEGILDVTRGKQSVSFPRFNHKIPWDNNAKPELWDNNGNVKPWDNAKPGPWDYNGNVKPWEVPKTRSELLNRLDEMVDRTMLSSDSKDCDRMLQAIEKMTEQLRLSNGERLMSPHLEEKLAQILSPVSAFDSIAKVGQIKEALIEERKSKQ